MSGVGGAGRAAPADAVVHDVILTRIHDAVFATDLEDCSVEDALEAAEAIRASLEARSISGPDGRHLRACVSAGCAGLDPSEPTTEALLRSADVALAMAKRAGRNQVVAA